MGDGRGSNAIYCRALKSYILINMRKCATFLTTILFIIYKTQLPYEKISLSILLMTVSN